VCIVSWVWWHCRRVGKMWCIESGRWEYRDMKGSGKVLHFLSRAKFQMLDLRVLFNPASWWPGWDSTSLALCAPYLWPLKAPNPLPWRRRQSGPPKRLYCTTLLHSGAAQKAMTWKPRVCYFIQCYCMRSVAGGCTSLNEFKCGIEIESHNRVWDNQQILVLCPYSCSRRLLLVHVIVTGYPVSGFKFHICFQGLTCILYLSISF